MARPLFYISFGLNKRYVLTRAPRDRFALSWRFCCCSHSLLSLSWRFFWRRASCASQSRVSPSQPELSSHSRSSPVS